MFISYHEKRGVSRDYFIYNFGGKVVFEFTTVTGFFFILAISHQKGVTFRATKTY
jgi:hypothetical protein